MRQCFKLTTITIKDVAALEQRVNHKDIKFHDQKIRRWRLTLNQLKQHTIKNYDIELGGLLFQMYSYLDTFISFRIEVYNKQLLTSTLLKRPKYPRHFP